MTYNISEDGTNKDPLDQENKHNKMYFEHNQKNLLWNEEDSSDYKRTVRTEHMTYT